MTSSLNKEREAFDVWHNSLTSAEEDALFTSADHLWAGWQARALASTPSRLSAQAINDILSAVPNIGDKDAREWSIARAVERAIVGTPSKEGAGQAEADERAKFEADAEPMGFDLTRQKIAVPEPWSEYEAIDTGHRWGGWLARAEAASPSEGGREQRDSIIAAMSLAHAWISSTPHGDNCFVSDHYEGDPGSGCNCGKDAALTSLERAEEELLSLSPSRGEAVDAAQFLPLYSTRAKARRYDWLVSNYDVRSLVGVGEFTKLDSFIDDAMHGTAPHAPAPVPEPLTESYVQPVPDHCDRITWRNRYYHLPLATPADSAQPAEPLQLARVQAHFGLTEAQARSIVEGAHGPSAAPPAPVAADTLTDAEIDAHASNYAHSWYQPAGADGSWMFRQQQFRQCLRAAATPARAIPAQPAEQVGEAADWQIRAGVRAFQSGHNGTDDLSDWRAFYRTVSRLASPAPQQPVSAEAMKNDARYRWLRMRSGTMKVGDPDESGYKHFVIAGEFEPMLDEAIDAALTPPQAEPGKDSA